MAYDHLKCSYCRRTAKDIFSVIEGVGDSNRYVYLEVLFLDKRNRPVCNRCMLEHNIAIKLAGKPVIWVEGFGRKMRVNEKALKHVVEEEVDLYPEARPFF